MRRLFFALWPDPGLRDRLARLTSPPPGPGRGQHPEDLHMTLVFLGTVAADRQAMVERLGERIRSEPFTLLLDRIEYWQRPRIRCLVPRDTPAPLATLVQRLQSGLADCGFAPESRPYRPHVTLLRKAGMQPSVVLETPIEWPVTQFVLAASGAAGPPRYQRIKRWPLHGG